MSTVESLLLFKDIRSLLRYRLSCLAFIVSTVLLRLLFGGLDTVDDDSVDEVAVEPVVPFIELEEKKGDFKDL